jgi:prepilin-type N-terminal cleavage/methylation domain-containing protein
MKIGSNAIHESNDQGARDRRLVVSKGASRGFTLIEIMIVIFIILIVSAVAVGMILPALRSRQVSEGARLLQAVLEQAHDSAIRARAPRGVRFIPDAEFYGPDNADPYRPLAYSRMILLETAPNYSEGFAAPTPFNWNASMGPLNPLSPQYNFAIIIFESKYQLYNGVTIPNTPTNWYWNIRVGDKLRFGNTGQLYTVIGPMLQPNPERFVNVGVPGATPPTSDGSEFLYLTNGYDDNQNGFVDESSDGVDNNGDGLLDYPTDPYEYEPETFRGSLTALQPMEPYTILRRPVPVQGSNQEVALPAGVVIDATSFNNTGFYSIGGGTMPRVPERSRLPVDPITGFVELMVTPSGQVIYSGPYSGEETLTLTPFYHFWLTERSDVHPAYIGLGVPQSEWPSLAYTLPMPQSTPGYLGTTYLKTSRKLVTLFTRTGMVVSNDIEVFSSIDPNTPYYQAQTGTRNVK